MLSNIEHSQDKSILVVSSQMGSISDNSSGKSYAYRTSKAAINCAMRSFALDIKNRDVNVMLIHPGWVQTDMGGVDALIDVKTSVAGMLKQVKHSMSLSHADKLPRFDGGSIGW